MGNGKEGVRHTVRVVRLSDTQAKLEIDFDFAVRRKYGGIVGEEREVNNYNEYLRKLRSGCNGCVPYKHRLCLAATEDLDGTGKFAYLKAKDAKSLDRALSEAACRQGQPESDGEDEL
jgi:hypothetical protein